MVMLGRILHSAQAMVASFAALFAFLASDIERSPNLQNELRSDSQAKSAGSLRRR